MGWFDRKKESPLTGVVQTRRGGTHPFGVLDGYVPLGRGEIQMYRAIREALPMVDAALVKLVRLATETLSGIPSIVYGLFGMLLFNNKLHFGYSLISGSLTLAIMILPLILRTTEEALLSVPDTYREGSFGLGAGKLRTVMSIVLPAAAPGILSGVILAIGRIVGETAALMYTSGTVAKIAGLSDSGITLALHMYKQASEGLYTEEAYATSVVLLVLVLLINFASSRAAGRIGKKQG